MKHTLTKRSTFFIYIGNEMIEDTRSILTVLLLHFISDTRVEQVANEVYRASQGWRPGCLDWDAEAGSFSHQHG